MFGVVLGIGALEVLLRAMGTVPEVENPLYSFHQSDEFVGWTGVPGIRQRFVRVDFDTLVEHTPEGFRRPRPEVPAAAGRSVLVLGDSFAWGWGVGQGELFTDWLQRALGPEVAIHNRGVNAFSTSQELLLLERELERRRYAEVVLVFSNNDFTDNLDGKAGRRPWFDLEDGHLVPRNQPPARLMSPIVALLKRSLAISWLDYRFSRASERLRGPEPTPEPSAERPKNVGPPPLSPQSREVTAALLREMNRLSTEHGAGFTILVWQGSARRMDILDICKDEDLACVDLWPSLDQHERSASIELPVDGHWSPLGHRVVAELVLESSVFAGMAVGRASPREAD